MRSLPAILLIAASLGAQDAYRASVDAWHARREASLAAENGWLTLIGRDWLNPGVNTLGSAPGSTVLLPAEVAPAFAGELVFEGKAVRFKPAPGSGLLLNGKPAVEAVLKTDMDGAPDVISAGRIKLHLIRRGERVAARVKDPEHPIRKAFKGVPRYAVDPAWRVEATYTPHPKPIVRAIPTVLGTTEPMTAPGLLRWPSPRRLPATAPSPSVPPCRRLMWPSAASRCAERASRAAAPARRPACVAGQRR